MAAVRAFGKSSADKAQRELARLSALEKLDILESPRNDGFERLVQLIKDIFSVEIGIVSLMDAHRQWYKACSGMPADEVGRDDTFCKHVLDCEEPLVVQDATKDARFAQHPAVIGEANIRFYAGVPLATKDGHVIGTVCAIDRRPRSFGARDLAVLKQLADVAMDRIELLQFAASDGLTGALTRRAFKDEADRLISLAMRHNHALACLVFDLDHFKKVNDSYGHAAGDDVLKAVSSVCRDKLRAGDLFGRLGGEEFAVLLPHVGLDAAMATAEKLRASIAAQTIRSGENTLRVTASLGLSTISLVSKDIETLLAQADAAMYRAKQTGRNRCMSWGAVESAGETGSRRRVLKAGTIIFNDRRSTIDCTVRSLGTAGAGLALLNSNGVPSDFVLMIKGEGLETNCRVIAKDTRHIEVSFV